jgi:excisionase family DNA binding protein
MAAPLVTADAIAECLGITTRSVLRMANRGTIPAVRLNPRLLRFDRDAVLAAIQTQQSGPSS